MKKAIILHGLADKKEYYNASVPSASNNHWVPWLQKQLQVNNVVAVTPEVPFAFELVWEEWVKEVERYDIDEDTDLIGHSCGGGFWIRYLTENPDIKVGRVVLVAPWLDLEKEYSEIFFDFVIDPKIIERTKGITIFNSDNDVDSIHKSVDLLMSTLPTIDLVPFHNYGHFTLRTMETTEFPELLEYIVGVNN